MKKMNIVYEDSEIIVINKPSGLLSVSTLKESENTLFHQVYTYLKQKHKNNKVFIVHRLDKDTSGLVLFAKNEKMKYLLQDNWDKLVINREYIAVVEGVVKNTKTIKSWLKETEALVSYSSLKPNDGKLAITNYKSLTTNKSFSLLEIHILTGRKNQIRVHMKDNGSPIVGDKKYGAKTNPIKRLGLHANKLELIHPITKKVMVFETKIPNEFIRMFPKK